MHDIRTLKKLAGSAMILILLLLLLPAFPAASQASQQTVHVVSIDGEINPAMAAFLSNALDRANREGAEGILIELSTLGGLVVSAIDMRDAMLASEVPVAVYIGDRAISAGALISIASDTLVMAPGSHIGAAQPVPNEPKILAFVSGEFRTTAEKTGRDPNVAMAMVDESIAIEGIVDKGEILDLTASEAYGIGFADHLASGRAEALKALGWEGAILVEEEPDFKYNIAQFLSSYEVAAALLMIGMLGLVIEFFTPGFGLAGVMGFLGIGLYFASGFLAGHTEWWSLLIFLVGVVLIFIEVLVPGFGVFGISGIIAICAGVLFAAPTLDQGIAALLASFAVILIAIPVLLKIFGKSRFIQRFVLSTEETTEAGYTHADNKMDFLGKIGVTKTVLRPSGIVNIDGTRIDAVADGDYIEKGVQVTVSRVEGTRIIVSAYNRYNTREDGT